MNEFHLSGQIHSSEHFHSRTGTKAFEDALHLDCVVKTTDYIFIVVLLSRTD